MARFQRITTIPLPFAPDQIFHSHQHVYAISYEHAEIAEIDPSLMQVSARIPLPGKPRTMLFSDEGKNAVILTGTPSEAAMFDPARRKITARISLPGTPATGDRNGNLLAVTMENRNSVARISLNPFKLTGETPVGGQPQPILFRRDGRTILTGTQSREIVTINAETGELLARLPLAMSPARFCFNIDGGQMFVTGAGVDATVIVSPYQNEVDQTVLAGGKPGPMAVSPLKNLLLLANPGSGDLTILDIDTRRLAASIHTGASPENVLITADTEYAMVVDRPSGNCAVVRISTALDHKNRTKPLFTVFPTTTDAVASIIVPFA